jgi:hypothetical protein
MVARNALVIIAGNVQEMPAGDSLNGTGAATVVSGGAGFRFKRADGVMIVMNIVAGYLAIYTALSVLKKLTATSASSIPFYQANGVANFMTLGSGCVLFTRADGTANNLNLIV